MTYFKGISIGLGIWALAWGTFYAGMALAESGYIDTFMKLFWLAYCLCIGVLIALLRRERKA